MTAPASQGSLFFEAALTPGECRAWRRPPKKTVSQWAEENRVITSGQFSGPWRNEPTPYLVDIMDTWQRVEVRRVSIMAPPQSGKTQAMHNCWAYGATVLQARSMWVLPDEDTAKDTCADLAEVITSSDKMSTRLTGRPRDLSSKRIRLMGSVTFSGWSSSPKRLARVSVEHLFSDEKGKWDGYNPARTESSPSSLARARLTAYPYTRKELGCSSPTIWEDEITADVMETSQELRVYQARCPDCGQLQIARQGQLRWDASVEDDPELVKGQNLAWYECEHCGQLWSQAKMRLAARTGEYGTFRWDEEAKWFAPVAPVENPISVGFHYSSFYSPFTTLGEIAAQAIRAGYRMDPETGEQHPPGQAKDVGEEHTLYNQYLALPYKNEEASREEVKILVHCDETAPRGVVPLWATHIFLCADFRLLGVEYTIRAWRAGPEGRSFLVAAGFFENLSLLEKLLTDQTLLDKDGNQHHLTFGLLDSGYEKEKAYNFCWFNPPIKPMKGQGEDGRRRPSWSTGYKPAKIEGYPGLTLYHLDANHYKNRLHQKIMMDPGAPGSWELHTDQREDGSDGLLADYARQLCGERMDERGLWIPTGGGRHDFLDCEYMQIACADILQLQRMNPAPVKQVPTDDETDNTRRRPSWRKSPRR